MKSNQTNVFTLMVDNEFGVLTRITAIIRRSGWNIRSLAVAETAVGEISRLTVCLECRHHSFEHVIEKLGRQSCVHEIYVFDAETQVARELAIFRMCGVTSALVEKLANEYKAQVIEEKNGSAIFSICCEPQELDRWIPELNGLGMEDITRTGTVALRREGKKEAGDNA